MWCKLFLPPMMRLYLKVYVINVSDGLVRGISTNVCSATKVHRTFQIKVTVNFIEQQ